MRLTVLKSDTMVDVLFGRRLRQLLESKNILQAHFADLIGVSRSRMNNYITQRSEPDYATLLRIANTLGTTIDFLLGRAEHQGLPQTSQPNGFPDFIPHPDMRQAEIDPSAWIPLYRSRRRPSKSTVSDIPLGWLRHETPYPHGGYRQRYALLMEDDSMKPYLLPGDIAYIQPMVIFHNCLSNSPTSDIYAARLHEEDPIGLSLKKCYLRGNLLVFFCENSFYSPDILNMTQIMFSPIVGKVMCVWRSCMDNVIIDSIKQK